MNIESISKSTSGETGLSPLSPRISTDHADFDAVLAQARALVADDPVAQTRSPVPAVSKPAPKTPAPIETHQSDAPDRRATDRAVDRSADRAADDRRAEQAKAAQDDDAARDAARADAAKADAAKDDAAKEDAAKAAAKKETAKTDAGTPSAKTADAKDADPKSGVATSVDQKSADAKTVDAKAADQKPVDGPVAAPSPAAGEKANVAAGEETAKSAGVVVAGKTEAKATKKSTDGATDDVAGADGKAAEFKKVAQTYDPTVSFLSITGAVIALPDAPTNPSLDAAALDPVSTLPAMLAAIATGTAATPTPAAAADNGAGASLVPASPAAAIAPAAANVLPAIKVASPGSTPIDGALDDAGAAGPATPGTNAAPGSLPAGAGTVKTFADFLATTGFVNEPAAAARGIGERAEPVAPAVGSVPTTGASASTETAKASGLPMPASGPPAEQVAIGIKHAIHAGKDQITIELRPANLGAIEVKLDFKPDGGVSAQVSADRPDTLVMLSNDQRGLEQALRDAGLNPDSTSLSFSLRDDTRSGQQDAQAGPSGSMSHVTDDDMEIATVALARPGSRHAGLIDLHA